MTNKQQLPAAPEWIDADTILRSIVETPAGERIRMTCGAANLRSVITDILEYARVHSVDDARVEGIVKAALELFRVNEIASVVTSEKSVQTVGVAYNNLKKAVENYRT